MYQLVSDIYLNGDNTRYVGFGIATDGYYIGDISTARESVEKLVHLCNTYELSNIHLMDVVEDWMAG